jgi:hypothetical protein
MTAVAQTGSNSKERSGASGDEREFPAPFPQTRCSVPPVAMAMIYPPLPQKTSVHQSIFGERTVQIISIGHNGVSGD